MKYNKSFKLLLCLALSFVFMFGNTLFIKAADNDAPHGGVVFDEVVNLPELWIDCGESDCCCSREYVPLKGKVFYSCLYPLGDKVIVEINDIKTESKDRDYVWEQSNFEYELVDEGKSAFVKLQGELIKRDAAGAVEFKRYIETNFVFTPPAKK